MTAAQFEELDEADAVEVLRWRFDVLNRAGYDTDAAAILAAHVEIDLRAAEDLVSRGCPVDTALKILL